MSHPHQPSPEPSPPVTDGTGPRKRGLAIKIVAVVLVLALIGGAAALAVAAFGSNTDVPGFGPDSHELTLTDSAGGMERDTDTEEQLDAQLDAAEQQFVELAETGDNSLEYTRVGVYDQADEAVGPVGSLVFIGAKSTQQQEPADYIAGVQQNAEQNGFTTEEVSAGDDAAGVCATQETTKIAICAWATNDTVGQLVPTVAGWTPDQLAELMVGVRGDVETTD